MNSYLHIFTRDVNRVERDYKIECPDKSLDYLLGYAHGLMDSDSAIKSIKIYIDDRFVGNI